MSAPPPNPPPEPRPPAARPVPAAGADMFVTLLSAGLFLYVGFVVAYAPLPDTPTPQAISIHAFTWGARIIGIAILVSGFLSWQRVPGAVVVELMVAAAATLVCLVVGAIWMAYGDTEGFLLLLFALLNGSTARSAWVRWQMTRAAGEPGDYTDAP